MESSGMLEDISNIDKLNQYGTNFQIWKFQVTIILKALGLLEYSNGKIKKPEDDKIKIENWTKSDAKVQKIIISTINKQQLMHIINCDTAQQMFEKIFTIYQLDNEQQKCNLLQEFYNYSYKNSGLAVHISQLENLAFRLNALNTKIDDTMLITKILTTLPDKYKHFVTAWESTQVGERTMTNLTARLLAGEARERDTKTDETNQAVTFKSAEKKCFVCKGNHLARFCPNKNNTSNQRIPCKFCRKLNHTEQDCFYRKNKYHMQKKLTDEKKFCFFTQISEKRKVQEISWIVDSGCSSHMVNQKECLNSMVESSTEIGIAKQTESMQAEAMGKIETEEGTLNKVLYVPDLSKNLLSVNAITSHGGEVNFTKDTVSVIINNQTVLMGNKNETGLYEVKLKTGSREDALIADEKVAETWHKKLGHLNYAYLKRLVSMSSGIDDLKYDENQLDAVCEVCVKSKQSRQPFNEERTRATRPLELVHTDLCGPITPSTWDNKKYIVTFLDDYTHFTMLYLVNNKGETANIIKSYVAEVESKWNLKVSKLRCDSGGEYISNFIKNWCSQKGIILDYTTPHTPQLNGKAERLNRTLMEKSRALLNESTLEKYMWGEAVRTAAYILNRSPTRNMNVTPAQAWFNRVPDLSRLQIFGTTAYAKIQGHLRKLDDRSQRCIFVGYAINSYRLWNPEKGKIFHSRDVIFDCQSMKSKISFGQTEDKSDSVKEIKEEDGTSVEINNQSSTQEEVPSTETTESRRSERSKKLPEKFKDYVLLTYEEAINGPEKVQWIEAIEEEKKALNDNQTWSLVNREEAGKERVISSRWIFRIKEDGKHKARLVIRGCEQKYGVNYEDTFSPVVNSSSLRILFALASKQCMKIMKFDVKSAFLYGHLDENIYMQPPEGYNLGNKICKLQKALYGLKQAPLNWNMTFTKFLMDQGLESLKSERCTFKNKSLSIILAIYVDDGLIIGNNQQEMEVLLDQLKVKFEITISKDPDVFLGIEILKSSDGLKLVQEGYSRKMLEKFRMIESKTVETPLLPNKEETSEVDIEADYPYREAVGSLLYLANKTRPDLAFSVGFASRHLDKPNKQDVSNVKRIFRYLNGTTSDGVGFNCEGSLDLNAYCDSDFAGDMDTRKSTTGYVVYFCGGPISWCSRKQDIVALSSTEAEYIAAAECCRELLYLKNLLEELVDDRQIEVNLFIDNQSAIKMIDNGIVNRRSKHIDVKYHFINEKVKAGLIKINYCRSEMQTADILTKPLGKTKFVKFKNLLLT